MTNREKTAANNHQLDASGGKASDAFKKLVFPEEEGSSDRGDTANVQTVLKKPELKQQNNVKRTIQVSEELKVAVSSLIKDSDFTFTVRCLQEHEILIKFTAKDAVLMDLEEIKGHLIKISKIFMEVLTKAGLNNKEH